MNSSKRNNIWIDSPLNLHLPDIISSQRIIVSEDGKIEEIVLFLESLKTVHYLAIRSSDLSYHISCSC